MEYTLFVGANLKSMLPLQHVDARFEVNRGQRIVGWEVVTDEVPGATGAASGKTQLNFVGANDKLGVTGEFGPDAPAINTANPPLTTDAAYYDANANAARVTAKLLGEPNAAGADVVTMAFAPASTDLTLLAHDDIVLPDPEPEPVDPESPDGGEGENPDGTDTESPDGGEAPPPTSVAPAAPAVAADAVARATQPDTVGEHYDMNRALVFSVGSPTQQMMPGEGVYIRVITQMTDELQATPRLAMPTTPSEEQGFHSSNGRRGG